jgi:hypothetical protein
MSRLEILIRSGEFEVVIGASPQEKLKHRCMCRPKAPVIEMGKLLWIIQRLTFADGRLRCGWQLNIRGLRALVRRGT